MNPQLYWGVEITIGFSFDKQFVSKLKELVAWLVIEILINKREKNDKVD